jgi:hypothetical protein
MVGQAWSAGDDYSTSLPAAKEKMNLCQHSHGCWAVLLLRKLGQTMRENPLQFTAAPGMSRVDRAKVLPISSGTRPDFQRRTMPVGHPQVSAVPNEMRHPLRVRTELHPILARTQIKVGEWE